MGIVAIIGLVGATIAATFTAIAKHYKFGPWLPQNQEIDDFSQLPAVTLDHTSSQEPQISPNPTNMPPTPNTASSARLDTFCTGVRDYEGKPGDLNYQLNNPLDCRPSPVGYLPKYQPVEIIDTDTDPRYLYHKGKFAKFRDYETGWEYGVNMVHFIAVNHPGWTILDFFAHFAPTSDGNAPIPYANAVASYCGVSPQTTLQALFG